MQIKTTSELRKLYGFPKGRAKDKDLFNLDKHAIHFINTSPFLVMSTSNKEGKLDASPRGGTPGFVKVINETEIVIPDSKGNNRLDSIVNILETGTVGLLFLIPGIDETLRVNGQASISTDAEYLELFTSENHPPKACIVVAIETLFLHCAKAFMRSKLWDEKAKIDRNTFPTMGHMLKDQLGGLEAPESREDMIKRYEKDL
ncbi:pyridoxamine 5'-phosphate oxidase family protein [Flavivirga spongiicola]|uniref:Pyridoxamine 5'-phosphate oxidase family protein n=1 Tax=Flavivirga spongiicola TaxID=421621 RepID=A0ABU7XYJ7_9FLAO|nr:pyridoxamine 5'-phosphate oxidase family protein [Flavivirga sp. MEBiC05379]MDO5980849.1 pyridoxamine 5'-phosphate oxidase family protein [Flavivirga sp. MEBiC05379]